MLRSGRFPSAVILMKTLFVVFGVTHLSQIANNIRSIRILFVFSEFIRYHQFMKSGNKLKPQDIIVLLKLITGYKDKQWRYSDLAEDLQMSQSEVHSAIKRAHSSQLYDPLTKRPVRANLSEFLLFGLKYVFFIEPGKPSVGIPTAHSAPLLRKSIVSEKGDQYVWPSRLGKVKGLAVEPLYPGVPNACINDKELYHLLTLVDALRVGRTREKELAKKLLSEKLGTL